MIDFFSTKIDWNDKGTTPFQSEKYGGIQQLLGPKGYTIWKECMTIEEQEAVRHELMVKAFVPKTSMAVSKPFSYL